MKQFIVHIRVYISFWMQVLLLSIASFNCIESPVEFISPTYNTKVNMPVLDKIWYFNEFASKDTVLKLDTALGTYSYSTTLFTEPIQIDSIKAEPDSSEQQVALGIFKMEQLPQQTMNLIAVDLQIPTGKFPPSVDASFSVVPTTFVDTSRISFIGVNSGTLTLTITNTLPFPIDFSKPIIMRNRWSSPLDNDIVAIFNIPDTLQQYQEKQYTSNLAGKLLRGIIATDSIKLHTTGSSDTVVINETDGLALKFEFNTLSADSALARINASMNSSVQKDFTIEDATVIREALFKAGGFTFTLNNNVDVLTSIRLQIDDFINTKTGKGFLIDTTLTGKQNCDFSVSMDTIRIHNTNVKSLGTSLNYSLQVTFINSGLEKRYVTRNDFVHAKFHSTEPLLVKYLNGRIKPTTMSINSGFKPHFDLGDIENKMEAKLFFKDVKLGLRLHMTGDGVPIDYENLILTAKISKLVSNQTCSVAIPDGSIIPGQTAPLIDLSGDPRFIDFTNFMGEYFPNLPDSFFVSGQLIVSPMSVFQTGNYYDVYDTSKVFPSFDINMPGDLRIVDGSIKEVDENTLKDQIDKSFTRSIISGTMNFEFTNRIPIAMSFRMCFLKWNMAGAFNDTLFQIDPRDSVRASIIENNIATSPRISNIAINLSGAQIDTIIQADSVFIQLNFNTGNGLNTVKLRSDDYIGVRASMNARYTINKP